MIPISHVMQVTRTDFMDPNITMKKLRFISSLTFNNFYEAYDNNLNKKDKPKNTNHIVFKCETINSGIDSQIGKWLSSAFIQLRGTLVSVEMKKFFL